MLATLAVLFFEATARYSTVLGMFFLFVLASIGFVFGGVKSIIHLRRYLSSRGVLAVLPAATALLTLTASLFGLTSRALIEADYRLNYFGRQEAVNMIETGRLQPVSAENSVRAGPSPKDQIVTNLAQSGDYLLPLGFMQFGNSEVVAYNLDGANCVLFFTSRDILGEFTGYVYRSDGQGPLPPHAIHGPRFTRVIRLGERWFWVTYIG